jgi:hypothetical protein
MEFALECSEIWHSYLMCYLVRIMDALSASDIYVMTERAIVIFQLGNAAAVFG